ncbi:MAG: A/G-specific adenine glycosylase [Clostridiaceae bacterium]|jgi:A/G-specific adenine glycosylase|nr:A/G-specific adenine glycosylase [Clostridiaceae bacterium]
MPDSRKSQCHSFSFEEKSSSFAEALLQWFDREARALPWRADPDDPSLRRDPYAVVLSELMLQQTQVTTVIDYFNRFMMRFPTIETLADADETEVLKLWEGLGYYRRARHLHALAKEVTTRYNGALPRDRDRLLELPGVGPYTAGAIRSFAYNLPDAAVDGNVVRIASRIEAEPYINNDARTNRLIRQSVLALLPDERSGDFNEALMDLGSMICTPKNPSCDVCPIAAFCRAFKQGRVQDFPIREKKTAKPVSSFSYVALRLDGRLFVRCRGSGLLEGLYEFLLLPKLFEKDEKQALKLALQKMLLPDMASDDMTSNDKPTLLLFWRGRKRAVFSHRIWEMTFWDAELISDESFDGVLLRENDLDSLMRDGKWVTRNELAALPFSAVLAPWRDALLDDCSLR